MKKHTLAEISDLEAVIISDHEELLYGYEHDEPNLTIHFDSLALTYSKDDFFEDGIVTSFVEELVATSSNETNEKLCMILTSASNDSTAIPSLSSEKSFEPASGEMSSEDIPSVSNIHAESASFGLH